MHQFSFELVLRVWLWALKIMQDYGTQGRLDTNDSLRLASLWHSMHAISKELSPVGGCTGIELLEADTFDLHCFQALTGMTRWSSYKFSET